MPRGNKGGNNNRRKAAAAATQRPAAASEGGPRRRSPPPPVLRLSPNTSSGEELNSDGDHAAVAAPPDAASAMRRSTTSAGEHSSVSLHETTDTDSRAAALGGAGFVTTSTGLPTAGGTTASSTAGGRYSATGVASSDEEGGEMGTRLRSQRLSHLMMSRTGSSRNVSRELGRRSASVRSDDSSAEADGAPSSIRRRPPAQHGSSSGAAAAAAGTSVKRSGGGGGRAAPHNRADADEDDEDDDGGLRQHERTLRFDDDEMVESDVLGGAGHRGVHRELDNDTFDDDYQRHHHHGAAAAEEEEYDDRDERRGDADGLLMDEDYDDQSPPSANAVDQPWDAKPILPPPTPVPALTEGEAAPPLAQPPSDPIQRVVQFLLATEGARAFVADIAKHLDWDEVFESTYGELREFLQLYTSILVVSPIGGLVTFRDAAKFTGSRRVNKANRNAILSYSASIGHVSCMSVCQRIKLTELHSLYRRRGLEATLVYDTVLHVAYADAFDLFVFEEGAVVWWGHNRADHWIVEGDFISQNHVTAPTMLDRHETADIAALFPIWWTYSLGTTSENKAHAGMGGGKLGEALADRDPYGDFRPLSLLQAPHTSAAVGGKLSPDDVMSPAFDGETTAQFGGEDTPLLASEGGDRGLPSGAVGSSLPGGASLPTGGSFAVGGTSMEMKRPPGHFDHHFDHHARAAGEPASVPLGSSFASPPPAPVETTASPTAAVMVPAHRRVRGSPLLSMPGSPLAVKVPPGRRPVAGRPQQSSSAAGRDGRDGAPHHHHGAGGGSRSHVRGPSSAELAKRAARKALLRAAGGPEAIPAEDRKAFAEALPHDHFVIPEHDRVNVMTAVSCALAQSVTVDYLEYKIGEHSRRSMKLPQELRGDEANRGGGAHSSSSGGGNNSGGMVVRMQQQQIAQQAGEYNDQPSDSSGNDSKNRLTLLAVYQAAGDLYSHKTAEFGLVEEPIFTWERPRYIDYYNLAKEQLSLRQRAEWLQSRVQVMSEAVTAMAEHIHRQNMIRADWFLILLLVIDSLVLLTRLIVAIYFTIEDPDDPYF